MSNSRQLPLDGILGTRANLRVLRAFHAEGRRLVWPTEIVRATGLSRAGVWKALNRLESWLIVEPVNLGHGRAMPYRWVRRHRLSEPLSRLFSVEAEVLWRLRIAGEPQIRSAFVEPALGPEIPPEQPRLW